MATNSVNILKPTEFELKLLRVLWRKKQLSGREVHEATEAATGWSYSTTRKTLDRMGAKGLLKIEHVHGVKTFLPVRSKLETMAGLIRDFTANILDADEPLPAATFAHSRIIDEHEIEALEALLQGLDGGDREK